MELRLALYTYRSNLSINTEPRHQFYFPIHKVFINVSKSRANITRITLTLSQYEITTAIHNAGNNYASCCRGYDEGRNYCIQVCSAKVNFDIIRSGFSFPYTSDAPKLECKVEEPVIERTLHLGKHYAALDPK